MKNRMVRLGGIALAAAMAAGTAQAYDCTNVPEWSASAIYTGTSNSYAKQNNIAYQAKWWTQNNPPASNSGQWDVWKSLGACDTGGADITPPSVPGGLSSSNITTSSITLSWAASTDAGSGVNNYELLRGGSLVASPTGTSHTDTGLSAGTAYSYQVRAKDKAGNVSALSAALLTSTASGNCAAAPATPGGLSSPSKSATSVNLAWNAVAAGPNCTVQYRVNQGATQVAQGAATSASVANLTPDTSYTFTVSAFNQAGSSQPSAPITVKTDTQTAGGKVLLGYFAQWGIYGRNYHVKNIDTSGSAANLTHINYAFGNVAPNPALPGAPVTCQSGDPWADYEKPWSAEQSVDGVAVGAGQPLRGNFQQLRQLKLLNPRLRVLVSLGGPSRAMTWRSVMSRRTLRKPSGVGPAAGQGGSGGAVEHVGEAGLAEGEGPHRHDDARVHARVRHHMLRERGALMSPRMLPTWKPAVPRRRPSRSSAPGRGAPRWRPS